MEIVLICQGKNDPPKLAGIPQPVIDLTHNETLTFCLIESGMKSGEPSVIFVSSDSEGSVCLQTSLDKFLSAAFALSTMAETNFNWVRQEGHFTIMPPSKVVRKEMLETIKKDLEEWDDVEEGES